MVDIVIPCVESGTREQSTGKGRAKIMMVNLTRSTNPADILRSLRALNWDVTMDAAGDGYAIMPALCLMVQWGRTAQLTLDAPMESFNYKNAAAIVFSPAFTVIPKAFATADPDTVGPSAYVGGVSTTGMTVTAVKYATATVSKAYINWLAFGIYKAE